MTSPTLNRLYASGGSEALLNTLQITVGGQDYWLVENFEDITAVTEAGATVTASFPLRYATPWLT